MRLGSDTRKGPKATRKETPGYGQKGPAGNVAPEMPYCGTSIPGRSTAKMTVPRPKYNGQGKLDILEEVKRRMESDTSTFNCCYPALKKGQVPEYWQWRKMCGHAIDVNKGEDVQACGQCSCVFPEDEHESIKPQKTKDGVTCSYEGYVKMKDLLNCF